MAKNIKESVSKNYIPYGADIKETRPYSPCRAACPVHTDIQAYIGLIAQGRYNKAFEVITLENPIASVCSMICHHPCEQACRRCEIDEPLSIRNLKRFAIEQSKEYRKNKRKLIKKTKSKSIGIIGSGPSGLTAANDLANLGYNITIYERHPVLGGILASAIPSYRLPREMLQQDIDDILSKGIKAQTNCEIGRDITIEQLNKKHDAVLIAIGLSKSRSLNIPGVEGPGVLLAIPFLEDVAFGRKPELGDNVLVIGGGNVAIDVARTAKRLGAKDVSMVCLESFEEMTAWQWEIDEALEENIKIHNRFGPKEIKRENNKIKGLEVVKVKSVFDENGRFKPCFYDDQTQVINADTIIITIGQMSDLFLLKESQIKFNERGIIQWDPETHMTSNKSIFVSGEIVTGPGSAIDAVANGHSVALAIHMYLEGKDIKNELLDIKKEKIDQLPLEVIDKIDHYPRIKVKQIKPEIRCENMSCFEMVYGEQEALKEAGRCRGCGGGAFVDKDKCMACLTCLRVCPYGAPVVQSYSEIRSEYCQSCGLCVAECPAQAISMISYDVKEFNKSMPSIVGKIDPDRKAPVIVAFICTLNVGISGLNVPENVRIVPIHCTSRIDNLDILKAIECGADGVAIIKSSDDSCKYKDIVHKVEARINRAKDLISMIGIEDQRIGLFTADLMKENPYFAVCKEFSQQIQNLGLR